MALGSYSAMSRQGGLSGWDLFNTYLDRLQKLQSGELTPQEMPEYKGLEDWYTKLSGNLLRDLYTRASAGGIRGGALGTMMQQGREQGLSELMRAMQQIYGQAFGQIPGAGQTAIGMDQQRRQMQMQYNLEKERQDMAKQQMLMQNIMQGLGMAGNVGAGIFGTLAAAPMQQAMAKYLNSIGGTTGMTSTPNYVAPVSQWNMMEPWLGSAR